MDEDAVGTEMMALRGEKMEQLRKATEADKERLFHWANDRQVREASFQTGEIAWEEHEAWFDRMMRDEKVCQFIYEQDGIPVGQVRLNLENQTARISYSIAKEYRGKGYAKRMLNCMEREIRNSYPMIHKLIADVKCINTASRCVFEQLGYGEDKIQYQKRL